jgi:hypothetical protein
MRYFTRGWANGELNDDESEQVVQAYRRHLESIRSGLTSSTRLMVTEVNLHDAVIDSIRWRSSRKELTITLATHAPTRNGYQTATLTYHAHSPSSYASQKVNVPQIR